MKLRIGSLVLLLCMPLAAQAQTYKCQKPDGSVTIQDRPCPKGSASSAVKLAPASPESAQPSGPPGGATGARDPNFSSTYGREKTPDERRQEREQAEIKAKNAEIDAHNRKLDCDRAQATVARLKVNMPVFTTDDNGERHYLEDKDRAAALADAEHRVADSCK